MQKVEFGNITKVKGSFSFCFLVQFFLTKTLLGAKDEGNGNERTHFIRWKIWWSALHLPATFFNLEVMMIGNYIKGTYVVTFGMSMHVLGNKHNLVEQISWERWWCKEENNWETYYQRNPWIWYDPKVPSSKWLMTQSSCSPNSSFG